MKKEEIEKINKRQVSSMDKHYRMRYGLNSNLVSYEKEKLKFMIHHSAKWVDHPWATAATIAHVWIKNNPELIGACSFEAKVIQIKGETGLNLGKQERDDPEFMQKALDAFELGCQEMKEDKPGFLCVGQVNSERLSKMRPNTLYLSSAHEGAGPKVVFSHSRMN